MHPEGKRKRQLWKIKQTRFLLCFLGGTVFLETFSSSTVRKGASFFKKKKICQIEIPPQPHAAAQKRRILTYFSRPPFRKETRTDFVQRPAALTTYCSIVIEKNLIKVLYT